MRAKEFIAEVKLHGTYKDLPPEISNPAAATFANRDLRNTDPYMQYRYGVALAGSRAVKNGDVEFAQESPWAENLGLVAFSTADEETIKLADKMMGVKSTQIAKSKSTEAPGAHTVSPVSKPKRNKYGV